MHFRKNVHDLKVAPDLKGSFPSILAKLSDNVARDFFVLVSPEDTDAKKMTMGYSVIYPGGRTDGHEHSELEEINYIIEGNGTMTIGDETFPIKAGDAIYVPFGPYHRIDNAGNIPITFLWIINKK